MYARMLVRQQPVQFQVDCGASANILPLRYAEGEELDSCSQMLVMWNGTKVTPVGSCALPVVNPKTNEKYKVRFLVVKEDLTPLLGLNSTQKMKLLTVHKENFINVVENANDDLTANYADVFNKGLKEHFQEKFTYKLTQIASLLSFQQEKYLCLFGRSSKKSSIGWNVLIRLL